MGDVADYFAQQRPNDAATLTPLQNGMKQRREQRNGFFHSAHLLGMSVSQSGVTDAFCDLFEYGQLLFGNDWITAIAGVRNLDVYQLLFRVEKKALTDQTLRPRLSSILADWPVNLPNKKRGNKGVHIVEHTDDLHLKLCVVWGAANLKVRLKDLLGEG